MFYGLFWPNSTLHWYFQGLMRQHIKKQRHTLPTKICLVKAMVFPAVMYGCESWTIKKAECQRIDAFELWCLRRLLRVLWTARRSNQSILEVMSPEYSLEGLMLKLKLQYFGHLMWRTDSLEKTLLQVNSCIGIITPFSLCYLYSETQRSKVTCRGLTLKNYEFNYHVHV